MTPFHLLPLSIFSLSISSHDTLPPSAPKTIRSRSLTFQKLTVTFLFDANLETTGLQELHMSSYPQKTRMEVGTLGSLDSRRVEAVGLFVENILPVFSTSSSVGAADSRAL